MFRKRWSVSTFAILLSVQNGWMKHFVLITAIWKNDLERLSLKLVEESVTFNVTSIPIQLWKSGHACKFQDSVHNTLMNESLFYRAAH